MFSKRELEGYLMIDHSNGEGITPEQAAQAGRGTIPVARGMKLQVPTLNCSQCERQIIINPGRTRDRTMCRKCGSYHCDECETLRVVTGVCKTRKQRIDEFVDAAVKGLIVA